MSKPAVELADYWAHAFGDGDATPMGRARQAAALSDALQAIDALTARVAELEAALRALNAEVAAGGERCDEIEDGLTKLNDYVDRYVEPGTAS